VADGSVIGGTLGRNASAFDDFLRDLDNMVNTATGRPPATAYLTVINNAHLVLADQPEAFFVGRRLHAVLPGLLPRRSQSPSRFRLVTVRTPINSTKFANTG
jgi:hypothetical protein